MRYLHEIISFTISETNNLSSLLLLPLQRLFCLLPARGATRDLISRYKCPNNKQHRALTRQAM